MRWRPFTLADLILRSAMIVALIGIGFAHNFKTSAPSPELAAFVALGGSLADVCGDLDGQGRSGSSECQACRIADAAALIGGCEAVPVAVLASFETLGFVAKRIHNRTALDPARLTRAPPLV
ncbi:hypothetical protein E4Z66_10910 [Aliishimia ponticola]|uniref:DUF2946 domain-containing protein n=1 Tax=Aliishimia ponticola TaxID=2499833 RepID=A0A4S4ND96_9RHOB|nr:hypothetical protein [Aliishimia ponticola]THH37409.1 hypothetical protein E4Z66_10910 [Aliishimia ponticola]